MTRRCERGKPCGGTCINKARKCIVELSKEHSDDIKKGKNRILEEVPHLAEHLAKGVIAWKTGKILGPMISAGLESQFGIPREASKTLAEAAVQATAAVALSSKDIKTAEDLIRKSIVEFSAAFVGKVTHSMAESAVSSFTARQSLEQALPILAGKVSGLSVAAAGSKLPKVSQISSYIAKRYKQDTAILAGLLSNGKLQFSEESDKLQPSADLISLLTVVSLLYYNEASRPKAL